MKTQITCAGLILTLAFAPAVGAADSHSAVKNAPGAPSGLSIYQLHGAWTDAQGRSVALSDFRGKPVVLAMFFTRCSGVCPLTVAEMLRIRAALPLPVRERTAFVLVSFDSEIDRPATLRSYRDQHGLDSAGWSLLNGPPEDVRALAMALGVQYSKTETGQFSHSSAITVLNAEGEIVLQVSPSGDGIVASVVAAASR